MKVFTLIFCLLIFISANAQDKISITSPEQEFRLPINYNVSLSANFAELRSNHFHSGVDFRTEGTVGKPIFAVADGYICRIRIMPNGYGQALYVKHNNGYTTVYAHLLKFNQQIDEYIKNYQYAENMNVVDLIVPENTLKVKQGDIIAYSGNTGSSMGPHLHFEIRDTNPDIAINPLLAYNKIIDNVRPQIFNIFVYPIDETSMVNKSNKKAICKASILAVGKYQTQTIPTVCGNIGFGIQGQDRMSNSNNKFGYYSIKMFVNDELYFFVTFDKINLNDTKYINSLGDYEHFTNTKNWIYKSFVDPNNKIDIYKIAKNNGIINTNNYKEKINIRYEVADIAGNISEISFYVKPTNEKIKPEEINFDTIFYYRQQNIFKKYDAKISIPEDALYNNINFSIEIDTSKSNNKLITSIYKFGNSTIPLHKPAEIEIPIDTIINPKIADKIILVKIVGHKLYYVPASTYSQNRISGTISNLGNYGAAIDTTAPNIRILGRYANANLKSVNKLSFSISDNLSGIGDYTAYIDGEWVILYFDQKTATLSHTFDRKRLKVGKKHSFRLIVKDKVGNSKEINFEFYK